MYEGCFYLHIDAILLSGKVPEFFIKLFPQGVYSDVQGLCNIFNPLF